MEEKNYVSGFTTGTVMDTLNTPDNTEALAEKLAEKAAEYADHSVSSNDMVQAIRARRTQTIIREYNKIGRNEPCPCGSGKKYKNCCLNSGKYEQHYELSPSEMIDVRFNNVSVNSFKKTA